MTTQSTSSEATALIMKLNYNTRMAMVAPKKDKHIYEARIIDLKTALRECYGIER